MKDLFDTLGVINRITDRREVNNEREKCLNAIDKLVVHGHNLALFLLSKCDVKAIVESGPGLRRDINCSLHQWDVGMKARAGPENFQVKNGRVANGNDLLPFGFGEGISGLGRENVRSNKIVSPVQAFVSEREGLHRMQARQHPGQSDRGVENVFHSSSRTSRRSCTTSISTFSCRRRSVMRSARSSMRRAISGSSGVLSIRCLMTVR